MAQKASPYAIRLGYNQVWNNNFFPSNRGEQIKWLNIDRLIRDYFYSKFPDTVRLKNDYSNSKITIFFYIPEVDLVLGENNKNLEKIIKDLSSIVKNDKIEIKLNLVEVKSTHNSAQSIANLVSSQIKSRLRSRQIFRKVLFNLAKDRSIKGVKMEVSGRIDGSDIAQSKKVTQGKIPLSTIDSNIEVGRSTVITSFGVIGIKVLIYKGRIWKEKNHVNT